MKETKNQVEQERILAAVKQALISGFRRRRSQDEAINVWEGTPFLAIFSMVEELTAGLDHHDIVAAGNSYFSRAREAYHAKRARIAIGHLYFALSYFLLAPDWSEAAAALGNLAMQFGEIGDYERAIILQEQALELKRQTSKDPSALARSLELIGTAHIYLGGYDQALDNFQQAQAIWIAESYRFKAEELERSVEKVKRQASLKEGVAKRIVRPKDLSDITAYLAKVERRSDDQEYVPTTLMAANAVGAARIQKNRAIELQALLMLAKLLYSPAHMYAEAEHYYIAAAELGRALTDRKTEATARLGQARSAFERGAPLAARSALEAALAIKDQDPLVKSEALFFLSVSYLNTGDKENAEIYIKMALREARQIVPAEIAADKLSGFGNLLRRFDFVEEAIRFYREGISLLEETGVGDRQMAALTSSLASALFFQGRQDEALATLHRSIIFAEAADDITTLAQNWINMGWAQIKTGDVESASESAARAEHYVEALADPRLNRALYDLMTSAVADPFSRRLRQEGQLLGLEKRLLDPASLGNLVGSVIAIEDLLEQELDDIDDEEEVRLLLLLASLQDRLGSDLEASWSFRQAFHLARTSGLTEYYGNILNDYGVWRGRNNFIHSARRAFSVALACKDRYVNGADRWSTLLNLAQASQVLGDLKALEGLLPELEQSLARLAGESLASAQLILAGIYLREGRLQEALVTVLLAMDYYEINGPRDEYLFALTLAIELYTVDENLVEAQKLGEIAFQEIESRRSSTAAEFQVLAQRYAIPTVWQLLRLYHRTGQGSGFAALQLLEHVKTRSLLEFYGENILSTPATMPANLREEEGKLLSLLQVSRWLASQADADRSSIGEEEVEARQALYQFWSTLPDEWSDYGRLRRGKPAQVETVIRRLGKQSPAHVLVYYPTAEATYVWHVDASGQLVAWDSLPIPRRALDQLVVKLSDRITRQESADIFFERLASQLLLPYLKQIPAGEMICIVPGGPLMHLPFAALPCHGGRLVSRNPLVMLPSLSMLALWDDQKKSDKIKSALVLGDSLGDLAGARKEAKTVTKLLDGDLLLGRKAARHQLWQRIRDYDLIHVACHARYNPTDPSLSGFYLADGSIFSARDLQRQRLQARLCVLSACESGAVKVQAGDELSGLSVGFIYSGLPSVVSTLWRVPDKETRTLMVAFYETLIQEKMNLAEALQKAQVTVLSRRKTTHPYHWAAFQLWGRWSRIRVR